MTSPSDPRSTPSGRRATRRLLRAVVGLLVIVMTSLVAIADPVAARVPVGQQVGQQLPVGLTPPPPPAVSAASWVLVDDTNGVELGAFEADVPRPMASTTKMMTAIVVLEHADPSDVVEVSEEAAAVGEAEVGLVPGERSTVRDLLTALLLRSANDAAMALAEHVGGTVDGFVALMNAKAAELGLQGTRFVNPHGLDAPGHRSTARDLYRIARHGMDIPLFAELVRTRIGVLPPAPDGTERIVRNTNDLLRTYPGAIGVKTGYTDDAGLVLVAAAERDGRRLYAVVMGSDDHFGDAAALLDHGFERFGVVRLIAAGETVAHLRSGRTVTALAASTAVERFGPIDMAARVDITPIIEVSGPVAVIRAPDGGELGRASLGSRPPPELPALGDAVAWASRYWDWAWGR